GFALLGLRAWLGRVEHSLFYLAGRAQQIADWHRDHRYCGRCGAETQSRIEDRAKACPECGLLCYPRVAPSMIVLVRNGDDMLLARNAACRKGISSTLADSSNRVNLSSRRSIAKCSKRSGCA